MSAPACSYFCSNGHLVQDIPHGYVMLEEDEKKLVCPYCNSKDIKTVLEWGDFSKIVPTEPIDWEKHSVSVPVYDVTKLFKCYEDHR